MSCARSPGREQGQGIGEECAVRVVRAELGPVSIVAGPRGVIRVLLGRELKAQQGRGPSRRIADRAARELEDYFAGRCKRLEALVDLSGTSEFQRQVLAACREVPYGQVATYSHIARAVGRPGSARAVGQALGANPVPLFVPCHRIVRADGQLGGFGAGLKWKRWLLALEGVQV